MTASAAPPPGQGDGPGVAAGRSSGHGGGWRSAATGLLSWLTTPSLLHGVALGVGACLLVIASWRLEVGWAVLVIALAACVVFGVGAILGHALLVRNKDRVWTRLRELYPRLVAEASARAKALREKEPADRAAAVAALPADLRKDLESAAGLVVGALLRGFAIARLFALLGVAISFAVFLATFLQVERLTEQNRLIRLEALVAFEEVASNMRGAASDARSLSTIAGEVAQALNVPATLAPSCDAVKDPWRKAFMNAVPGADGKDGHDHAAARCLQELGEFLLARSEALQANRFVTLQVGRQSAFTRDITEQFLVQFAATCDADPEGATAIGELWSAVSDLQAEAGTIVQLIRRDEEIELFAGSAATRRDVLIVPFERVLRARRMRAITADQLRDELLESAKGLDAHLRSQQARCDEHAKRLADDLALLLTERDAVRSTLLREPAAD